MTVAFIPKIASLGPFTLDFHLVYHSATISSPPDSKALLAFPSCDQSIDSPYH